MKSIYRIILISAAAAVLIRPAVASTNFLSGGDAVVSAKWDTWSWGDASGQNVAAQSGSQGSAQTTTGTIGVSSSEVTTTILAPFDNPPGGFNFNPDTFYVHNGAFEWATDVEFAATVEFVRLSYSLLGSGFGPASAFPNAPGIDVGSSTIDTNSYVSDSGTTVFYSDFQLDSVGSTFELSFGDQVFPGFPGSFRSVDAIQVEGFNGAAPVSVPEPAAFGLALALAVLGLTAARRPRLSRR